MNIIQAIILGILQGFTEFLPISSSGHLVIGQKLFEIGKPLVLFDILVHVGTLSAIVLYFNKKILDFFRKINNIKLVAVGTLPAVLVGLFLNRYIEVIFNSLSGVGFYLIITSIFLFSTKFIKKTDRKFNKLNWIDVLIIGCFQALAILPGISRSGLTTVAGLWRGLKRKTAFVFSFYLAIPAILGALTLHTDKLLNHNGELKNALIGFITAAISGLLALKIFEKAVLKGKLFYFGIYCFLLGGSIVLAEFILR